MNRKLPMVCWAICRKMYSPCWSSLLLATENIFMPFSRAIVTNLSYPPKGIVRFYNGRGTAEQWIKEGKYALNWTRLSCHKFVANQVRLWLFVLTYNLGNFMRRLVLPEDMKHWTLTSLQARLIKTGGRLVCHARRLVFQLAEVLVTREMLTGILERISRLRLAPG